MALESWLFARRRMDIVLNKKKNCSGEDFVFNQTLCTVHLPENTFDFIGYVEYGHNATNIPR